MAASYESPTEYINHHLTFLTKPVGTGDFWTVNADTIITSIFVAVLTFGFLWLVTRKATGGVPSKTQAFVELAFDFVNDQVKSIYHGTSRIVAPIALTTFVFVLMLNAMDFLPIDIVTAGLHAIGFEHFRFVPTADVNTTFALALSVFGLMIFYSIKIKGLGGWIHDAALPGSDCLPSSRRKPGFGTVGADGRDESGIGQRRQDHRRAAAHL